MAYTYPVKWITNTMRGAPQISGTTGTFIGALDAFLLTGWGTATATSVSVSGGVGTALFAEGVFFEDHAICLIAGVTTPAALNGEGRVLSHTNSSITFETNAPDGVATTGTSITFKYAPVGSWSKAFAGTNLAAYKSTDVQSSGHYLRMDDSATLAARVVGYETMTDVNTGSGLFPTSVMVTGGGYWHKSILASAAAVRYTMAADARAVLVAVEPGTAANALHRTSNVRGFGDPVALASSGDVWASFLSAPLGTVSSNFDAGALSGGNPSSAPVGFTVFARAFSALGSSVFANSGPFSGSQSLVSGNDALLGAAPSAVDGQIKLSRMFLREQAVGMPPRAIIPGVCYVPQSGVAALMAPGDIATGSGEWAGRKLMAVYTGNSHQSNIGIAFIDLMGPWR